MANKSAREIIGDEEFNNLRTEFMDELCNEDANPMEMYNNIEDLMLDYGLEMDYLFDVIGY